ncbi:anaerobic sulfatase maturase [Salmonella bongori]|uniref:anaerobic sulfatase maturase n=1 Tax=Salmonella bongori TaxID=54736 RepID=UPI0009AA5266|nr:anaerobic sulfatase maturase [Salmonella bongori]EGE4654948.1 anaerobic sulfatase maturase [Salmonella bongori serovar 40:z35:- str. 95-0123]EGE4659630.1 anaerobic sulfatase maturase [Salmonella bongori serovar 48:i:- str. 94-0708]ECC8922938.1 anaerobic sulfatase maturase [Salmonella bongori]ECC9595983.1 anaerobic sulfatase maturase [Salmonella bongori]EDP8662330.1 anaerobic sulfatase maturase [Salmonella bongori]
MNIVFNTVAKPSGSLCNLSCKYCFYLDKPRAQRVMSDDVLETYIRRVIDDTPSSDVSFCWQGGEPTLCGLSFYQKVVLLQQRYANGKTIHNSLQTNGVLINEEWAAFFAQHHFLLGISIDGPQVVHDHYRKTASGRASFSRVVNAIRLLQANDVEFNTLTVVNDESCRHGNAIYRFLTQELGSRHLQFIPVVEQSVPEEGCASAMPDVNFSPSLMPFSVTPEGWGAFMCDVFDKWIRHDVGRIFVQLFDNLLGVWMGEPATLCTMQPTCGQSLLVEQNGDVFSCDHFVFPSYKLGNLRQQPLKEMAASPFQQQFGAAKANLSSRCQNCTWRFACHGGCPKHRICREDSELQNYLCKGYLRFFQHITPYMNVMRQLLLNHQPAAHITRIVDLIAKDARQ